MSLLNILLFFISFSLLLRFYLIPLLVAQLTQFRVSAFSIFSARGLEYRSKGEQGSNVPTGRIEKAGWAWGGMSADDVGLVVLKVDGVSIRLKKGPKGSEEKPHRKSVRVCRNSLLSVSLAHLRHLDG